MILGSSKGKVEEQVSWRPQTLGYIVMILRVSKHFFEG